MKFAQAILVLVGVIGGKDCSYRIETFEKSDCSGKPLSVQQFSDQVGTCFSKSTYDIQTHCNGEGVTFKRFSDPVCSPTSYMPEKDVSLVNGKCDMSIFGQGDGSESYVIVTMLN